MGAPADVPCYTTRLMVVSLIVVFAAHAGAQESVGAEQVQQGGQQSQPLTKKGKTVKKPPAPLYSKHGRGMYKNAASVEVIDATPQSPPLEVDDPGVPDKGQYEINFTTEADLAGQLRAFDFLLVDANYGVVPKLFGHELPTQIKLEFPLAGAQEPGGPLNVGVGATQFGLKFNFYDNEHTGLSVAFYPQIEFGIPGTEAAKKNLVNAGETLILPMLMRKEFKYLTVAANGAVNEPIDDPSRATTGALGFGFGRAITRYMAAMGEIRGESAFDFKRQRLVVVNFGLMRRLRDNVILYANAGRSIYSDDSLGHLYAGGGVKFLISPKRKKRD
jgi:hypothetical protein